MAVTPAPALANDFGQADLPSDPQPERPITLAEHPPAQVVEPSAQAAQPESEATPSETGVERWSLEERQSTTQPGEVPASPLAPGPLGDTATSFERPDERSSESPKLGVNPLRDGSSPKGRPRPPAIIERPPEKRDVPQQEVSSTVQQTRSDAGQDKPGDPDRVTRIDFGHQKPDDAVPPKRSDAGQKEPAEQKFDPIKENGKIFEGWSTPKLVLVISGRQDGYLEPCGCAGLERMKGGLSRRHSMFEHLRKKYRWPVVGVDVGGLVKGFGPQADLKFQTTVNAMQIMNYDAIALGKSEAPFDVGLLISPGTGDENPFLSANVAPLAFEAELISQMRIVQAGGMKVGITSVLGSKWWKEVNNKDVVFADPAEKLARIVPALKKECDLLVLLAHATMKETEELARKFPQFDVVVTADGAPEPPPEPNPLDGSKATLVEVGHQTTYAIVLGFFDGPSRPPRYQRVPLDSRFSSSKEMKELMTGYQEQLEELWLEDLEVPTVLLPRKELLGKFVGSKKCEDCHEESYKVWKKSGHAKAWETLVKADPPRDFDPECVSCHVVGWHPQDYAPYETGFLGQKETPHLVDVGCESCHGPGENHVKAEMGSDLKLQRKLQEAMVITLEQSQQAVSRTATDQQPCMNCHDLENSPDFEFKSYWRKIEHREE